MIDLWKAGRITICLSGPIVDEYVEVLRRMGLRDEVELKALLALFARSPHCLFTANPPEVRMVDTDPDDDKFLACAAATGAQRVVSGDKALLAVKSYLGIRVVTARELVEQFPADESP